MKTILATGELGTLRNVARASWVAMMPAPISSRPPPEKESVNATLPVGLVMVRAAREYQARTGYHVGFQTQAGGIRTAKDALAWMVLMKEEMSTRYLQPDLFRFGASSLLADIERQLEHYVTVAMRLITTTQWLDHGKATHLQEKNLPIQSQQEERREQTAQACKGWESRPETYS